MPNFIVVVPDGIRKDKDGNNCLSNTYRAALEAAEVEYRQNDGILLLLPGNSFGGNESEEVVAARHLSEIGIPKERIAVGVKTKSNRYVDTAGNFKEVIENGAILQDGSYICGDAIFREGHYSLVACRLHMDRAVKIIRWLRIKTPSRTITSYAVERGAMPARLWYYRFKLARAIYEKIATVHAYICLKAWRSTSLLRPIRTRGHEV